MSLPSSYSEADLQDYLHAYLGVMAAHLGWSIDAGSYDEIVNDVLLLSGEEDVADLAVATARVAGRYCLWRAVRAAAAGEHRFAAQFQSYDRQQLFEHAGIMLAEAERELAEVAPGLEVGLAALTIGQATVTWLNDPYDATLAVDREY